MELYHGFSKEIASILFLGSLNWPFTEIMPLLCFFHSKQNWGKSFCINVNLRVLCRLKIRACKKCLSSWKSIAYLPCTSRFKCKLAIYKLHVALKKLLQIRWILPPKTLFFASFFRPMTNNFFSSLTSSQIYSKNKVCRYFPTILPRH